MNTHAVFASVVQEINGVIEEGAGLLAPWMHLEAARLLGQLGDMLQGQVESLRTGAST